MKNKGFSLIEIMIAFSMVGLLSIVAIRLISDKKTHSDNAIVRTRELTDLIRNLRQLKKDVEFATSIQRVPVPGPSGYKMVLTKSKIKNSAIEEITIEFERVFDCHLGNVARVQKDNSGQKTQYDSGAKDGNFSCLKRTTLDPLGNPLKSIKLTGIKDLKWCITSEDCTLHLSQLAGHEVETPATSFPASSPSMLKLQIFDYKGVLIKMVLGLSNIGHLDISRKDIILVN